MFATKPSNFHNKYAKLPCAEVYKQPWGILFCRMLYAILLFVEWNVMHIWEVKATYMNFIDCTHNLTNFKMCTSQHRYDDEETIQPDSLRLFGTNSLQILYLYIYARLTGSKSSLDLHIFHLSSSLGSLKNHRKSSSVHEMV